MKINYKIVAALLAAGWAYDMRVIRTNKKKHLELIEEFNDLSRLTNLYANMLNKNHVNPDDFERVIMNEYSSKLK